MSANKKINLKELDINNIGGWPRQAQMGFCAIVGLRPRVHGTPRRCSGRSAIMMWVSSLAGTRS